MCYIMQSYILDVIKMKVQSIKKEIKFSFSTVFVF